MTGLCRTHLSLNWQALQPLELDASQAASLAEPASIVDGKPDATKIDEIDLEKLAREFRMQRIVFEAALDVYDEMQTKGRGGKPDLLGQLVRLIEQLEHGPRPCPAAELRDTSASGVLHLAGNVSEWTQSIAVDRGNYAMWVQDGNWLLPGHGTAQGSFGRLVPLNHRSPDIGIRVVYDQCAVSQTTCNNYILYPGIICLKNNMLCNEKGVADMRSYL